PAAIGTEGKAMDLAGLGEFSEFLLAPAVPEDDAALAVLRQRSDSDASPIGVEGGALNRLLVGQDGAFAPRQVPDLDSPLARHRGHVAPVRPEGESLDTHAETAALADGGAGRQVPEDQAASVLAAGEESAVGTEAEGFHLGRLVGVQSVDAA